MSSQPTMHTVDRVDAWLDEEPWIWADANHDRIAAHWAARKRANPALFNGRVLVARERRFVPDALQVRYAATDYASFLAFCDLAASDPAAANCFGMAALRGADGAFLLGVMAPHTAHGGRVYFPAGTPDPSDVRPDGRVDLLGNVLRELAEETGIGQDAIRIGAGWTAVIEGRRTALMRELRMDLPGLAIRERILAFLASEAAPEFTDIQVVRCLDDIDRDRVPGFVQAYLHQALHTG